MSEHAKRTFLGYQLNLGKDNPQDAAAVEEFKAMRAALAARPVEDADSKQGLDAPSEEKLSAVAVVIGTPTLVGVLTDKFQEGLIVSSVLAVGLGGVALYNHFTNPQQ